MHPKSTKKHSITIKSLFEAKKSYKKYIKIGIKTQNFEISRNA